MSEVKAEVLAVRELRSATNLYAQRLRAVIESARRESMAMNARLSAGVDVHRGKANRARQELLTAQRDLERCVPERQAAAQAAVAKARLHLDQAEQLLLRARNAHQQASSATSQLLKVLHQVSAVVDQHNSAASVALNELDRVLAEMTSRSLGERVGDSLKAIAGTIVVSVEVASTAANLAGPIIAPAASDPVQPDVAIAQMNRSRLERDVELLGDHLASQQERQGGLGGAFDRPTPPPKQGKNP